jgi:hypothetical protein
VGFLAALATGILIGTIASFEALNTFRDASRLLRCCWWVVAYSFLAFAAFGFFAYTVVLAAAESGFLELGGGKPSELTLIPVALAFAQFGRIEAPAKSEILGSVMTASDRESYYGKGLRMFRSSIYRRWLQCSGHNRRSLDDIVMAGLVAAFLVDEVANTFDLWIDDDGSPETEKRKAFRNATLKSTKITDDAKKRILLKPIIRSDQAFAIQLACRRASAIVDQQAFK